jgi:Uma2 family endonuclease
MTRVDFLLGTNRSKWIFKLAPLYSPLPLRRKRVAIYRENQPVEILENPMSLSGETVLEGFTLNLADLWEND